MSVLPLQPPPRVLVVDDDPGVAESLVEFLADFGIDADAEGNAVTALQRLGEQCFDVAIVDLHLPEMSGEELVIRAGQVSARLVFLIMTGAVSYVPPPHLQQLGIRPEHVFQKPVPNLGKLVKLITRLTETRAETGAQS